MNSALNKELNKRYKSKFYINSRMKLHKLRPIKILHQNNINNSYNMNNSRKNINKNMNSPNSYKAQSPNKNEILNDINFNTSNNNNNFNNIQSYNFSSNTNNKINFLKRDIPLTGNSDMIYNNNKNDKEQVDNIKSMFDKLMVDMNN